MAEEDEFNALSKELESIKESLRTNTIQLRQMVEELSGVLPLMDIPRNLGEKIEEIRFRLAEAQHVCENATDTKFQGLLPSTLQEPKEQDPTEKLDRRQEDGGLPFVEEAARKSQELTEGFGSGKLSDVVSEASKRSKELAVEASKKSKELAAEVSKMSKEFTTEALKCADQITTQIPLASMVLTNLVDSGQKGGNDAADLEKFGVTEELREFVKGIRTSTFRDFPLEDDSEVSHIPTVSNVRQDLTEWQERHAKLVLSTVKEISKLRYQLCPRGMKERKFWRIYFILVNSYVAPYKKLYMEDVKLKATEKAKDDPSSVLGRFWEDLCLQLMAAATLKETTQVSLVGVLRARLKQGEGNVASGLLWFDEKGESLNSSQGGGLNFDGVGNDMALQIDKDPHRYHCIVHGWETSQRLFAFNILVSGEITKNLICVGTKAVTLYDGDTKELWNLSNRFVGSKEELEESGPLTCVQRMQGLDISVIIPMLTSELAKEQFSDFQRVASTNIFLEKIVESDDYPYQYQPPLAFIKYEIMGLCGSAWRLEFQEGLVKYIRLKRTIWEICKLDCILGSLSCCFRAKKWPQEPLPPPEPPPPPSLGKKRMTERR